MQLREAYREIKAAGYDVRWMNSNAIQIDFDFLFDDFNCAFADVIFTDGKILITDYAEYEEILDEHTEEDIAEICVKHDCRFDNYHIEKEYNSIDDVKKYEACILEIRKFYSVDRLEYNDD